MGFLIMGAIGYFIKLSTRHSPMGVVDGCMHASERETDSAAVHIPVNNVLVG